MRLFLAVAADDEVKAAAAQVVGRLRRAPGDYRWVEPRDMHVTLRFLGETPDDQLPRVESLMRSVAAAVAPFDIVYGELGAFDSWVDMRVVWIGLCGGEKRMEALANALGREEARPYRPHLTLGRRRRESDPAEFTRVLRAEPKINLRRPVAKISLYASHPASFGHTYEIVADAPLLGG